MRLLKAPYRKVQTTALLFIFTCFQRYLHSHVEIKCFLCALKLRIYISASLCDVGKCNTYRITCIIVECAGCVGRSLGCEINDLSINGVSAVEINRYVVCVRLSCRCPCSKSALGDDVIIQLCASCKCGIQEINCKILMACVGRDCPGSSTVVGVVGRAVYIVKLRHVGNCPFSGLILCCLDGSHDPASVESTCYG